MKKLIAVAVAFAPVCLSTSAWAVITIDTVFVGDPGNTADTRVMVIEGSAGYGSVPYVYNIGKYEVTAGQYTAFLNSVAKTDTYGLYNPNMWDDTQGCKIQQTGAPGNYSYSVAADYANRPVNFVSFWDGCRFANWMGNGQLSGAQDASTTERGAYTLDGYNGTDGRTIQRNASWSWAVTSEDEWYKAAYYKGGGLDAGYWLYPTQGDVYPTNAITDPDGGNNVNAGAGENGYAIGFPYFRTEVGEYENSESAYGTFDQGGNVMEWQEAIFFEDATVALRGLRGGSFEDYGYFDTAADIRLLSANPSDEFATGGFRLSQVVPEPASVITLICGLTGLAGLRLRRR